MGEKLIKYYKFVKDEMGFSGQIKLAQITKIPSTRAAIAPDDEKNTKIFKNAIKKLTGKEYPFSEE